MNIIQSEIKMRGAYNEFVGLEELQDRANGLGLELNPVDIIGKDFWSNEEDTLVIKVDEDSVGDVRQLAILTHADECDLEKVDGEIIFRLWWD